MAFDLDDLSGHLSEVLLDTRKSEDPWGFGISAVLHSTDSPEWRQHVLEQSTQTAGAAKVRRVIAETVSDGFAQPGFRQKKTLSAGEKKKHLEDKLSEPGEVEIDLYDLRKKKEGIARILVKSATGPLKGGVPVDLSTPEKIMAFLDHEAYEINGPDGKQQKVIPLYQRNADGSFKLDSANEPLENPY